MPYGSCAQCLPTSLGVHGSCLMWIATVPSHEPSSSCSCTLLAPSPAREQLSGSLLCLSGCQMWTATLSCGAKIICSVTTVCGTWQHPLLLLVCSCSSSMVLAASGPSPSLLQSRYQQMLSSPTW